MRIRLRDFEIEFYLLCLLTYKKSCLARASKLVKVSPKYRPKRSQERACPTRATFIQYREAHYPIRLPSHRSLTSSSCKQRSAIPVRLPILNLDNTYGHFSFYGTKVLASGLAQLSRTNLLWVA